MAQKNTRSSLSRSVAGDYPPQAGSFVNGSLQLADGQPKEELRVVIGVVRATASDMIAKLGADPIVLSHPVFDAATKMHSAADVVTLQKTRAECHERREFLLGGTLEIVNDIHVHRSAPGLIVGVTQSASFDAKTQSAVHKALKPEAELETGTGIARVGRNPAGTGKDIK
jgi:hypothetical protein